MSVGRTAGHWRTRDGRFYLYRDWDEGRDFWRLQPADREHPFPILNWLNENGLWHARFSTRREALARLADALQLSHPELSDR